MEYTVIIPAAGSGKRMNAGKNKQFIMLGDKPVIIHTLSVFEQDPHCNEIILVINEMEREYFKELLCSFKIQKVKQLIPGGAERQDSVYNGLMKVEGANSLVLVHDGARPFITIEKIQELVKKASETSAAILAVPVKDTIKKVNNGLVEETVERSSLWAVQTPQAFHVQLLRQAYEHAFQTNFLGTDEASLVERLHKPIAVVSGDYENIKLTTPEDIVYGESILNNQQK
ncbi:2-C-methyl-D-erythritol 4-phosphate cytidylyltransferase [Bacillus suaedaesalsae]|uniref:2-C-methyl-D-erythritol 4-phosphate cytidylyltransferase n=1 Tax=Bacillus suaedaesalsae TaxID=2810349 RepID=A0ABS2DCD2_9BACI|nr:2-C-methyl-D-erythritol 4-phosphate cytidylyltransferase [Bacillus suaedaesalsae]MBM6616112.1 2-C-methyl-D-erythritol 4-phosphate cytidylyltransferase [Bacillus suaedaesalsae]